MQAKADSTVTILPETEGNLICVKISGLVTADDYIANFKKQIEALIEEFGEFRLLMHYDDSFKGYTEEAAEASMKNMMELGKHVHKQAYINVPTRRVLLHKILPDVIRGETRYFDKTDVSKALDWLNS